MSINQLFTLEQDCRYYLVVDRVRVPDIEEFVYQHEPNPNVKRLFLSSPLEHLLEWSPVVINFGGSAKLMSTLRDDFALRSSSVILVADQTVDELLVFSHLQSLLTVLISNTPVLFRFYSSQLWQKVSQHIDDVDLTSLLGPCHSILWISEQRQVEELKHPTSPSNAEALIESPVRLHSSIFQALV